jgi:hypothetical protein
MIVIWDATTCRVVSKDGGRWFLQNISTLPPTTWRHTPKTQIFTAATALVSYVTVGHREEILNRFK